MFAKLTVAVLAACLFCVSMPASAAGCADLWEWLNSGCRRLVDTYETGSDELIVSGYAWHAPWTWAADKRAEENEAAWGGGWGRTVEREDGDTDTVYFLVFNDSHSRPQYQLGYGRSTYWRARDSIQPGLGYTLMLVARNDIFNGWPFPAVLPLASLRYDRYTLYATYIPTLAGVNNGSILYIFGKITLH
jgi:lipid IVA palmitoyltransferase